MTYPATESQLARLRDELSALRERSCGLENELRKLRRDHDAHLREIAAERDRREHARFMRMTVLISILWALEMIALCIPGG